MERLLAGTQVSGHGFLAMVRLGNRIELHLAESPRDRRRNAGPV